MKAVAHRLVLLVVHLQEEHIWVLLRKLTNLGVKSTAAATARGEKVDDDELVAGVGQGIDKVLGGLDLTHVGLQPLLPPPHRFPNRKIHVHLRRRREETPGRGSGSPRPQPQG